MSPEQFDKKFDHLVRKAAEQYHAPHSEEAWQKMEQLIEKDRKRKRFVIWWWSLPLLLLISFGTYTAVKSKAARDLTGKNETLAANKMPASKFNDEHKLPADTIAFTTFTKKQKERPLTKPALVNQHSASADFQNEPAVKTNNTSDSAKIDNRLPAGSSPKLFNGNIASTKALKQPVTRNRYTTPSDKKTNNISDNEPRVTDKPRVKDESEKEGIVIDDGNKPVNISTWDTASAAIPLAKSEVVSTPDTINSNTTVAKELTKTTVTRQKTKNTSKFDLSLLLAGDITTAEFKSVKNVSGTVGLGIAYNLTPRLGIATGFSVSNKIYQADSTTYKTVYSPGPNYYLKNINARCLVFDVPVNVLYRFSESNNSSWYAIAGLSTYFMNREKYDYQYIYYYQPKNYSYTLNNQNQHWFSVLNLSVAYRRETNKNIEWQLAPFAKIPLTGIGDGKVKLYSLGLQFSIHLHP